MRSAIPRDLVSPSGYPSSVGASHPRRRLSSSVGTTYLRRTESGRPNLTETRAAGAETYHCNAGGRPEITIEILWSLAHKVNAGEEKADE